MSLVCGLSSHCVVPENAMPCGPSVTVAQAVPASCRGFLKPPRRAGRFCCANSHSRTKKRHPRGDLLPDRFGGLAGFRVEGNALGRGHTSGQTASAAVIGQRAAAWRPDIVRQGCDIVLPAGPGIWPCGPPSGQVPPRREARLPGRHGFPVPASPRARNGTGGTAARRAPYI
jgi:hypothetical protein